MSRSRLFRLYLLNSLIPETKHNNSVSQAAPGQSRQILPGWQPAPLVLLSAEDDGQGGHQHSEGHDAGCNGRHQSDLSINILETENCFKLICSPSTLNAGVKISIHGRYPRPMVDVPGIDVEPPPHHGGYTSTPHGRRPLPPAFNVLDCVEICPIYNVYLLNSCIFSRKATLFPPVCWYDAGSQIYGDKWSWPWLREVVKLV